MNSPSRLEWARAFMQQAKLDLDFACALYSAISNARISGSFGSRPDLYCPAIYAYYQQAVEKALKAWLWHATGGIPKRHNPLSSVLHSGQMKAKGRPRHLDMIDRNRRAINRILNMAPGAASEDADLETLLKQPNTEYPFAGPDGCVRLPHEEISRSDVAAVLHIAGRLVLSIQQYLEAAALAQPSTYGKRSRREPF